MATQHDHFIGFVTAANLTNRVVGSGAFGIDAIDDIKFEYNFGAVIENPADTPEVFIAHHHCRDYFANVKCLVVESSDLPKLATRVIDSNFRTVRFKKRVELLVNLTIRQRARRVCGGSRSWRCGWKCEWPRVWTITLLSLFVSLALRRRIQVNRYRSRLADKYNVATHFCFVVVEKNIQLFLRWPVGQN